MHSIFVVLVGILASSAAFAGRDLTERDAVAKFIADKMIGKTLVISKKDKLGTGTSEFEFNRKTIFSDLHLTPEGLTFKGSWIISQTNYDLDKDGKRIPGKVFNVNRVLTSLYELRQSRASGKMVGLRRSTSNTLDDSTGVGETIYATLKGDALTFKTQMLNYGDFFGPNDTRFAGTAEGSVTFEVKGGKLTSETKTTSYHFDAEKLERGERIVSETYADTEL